MTAAIEPDKAVVPSIVQHQRLVHCITHTQVHARDAGQIASPGLRDQGPSMRAWAYAQHLKGINLAWEIQGGT